MEKPNIWIHKFKKISLSIILRGLVMNCLRPIIGDVKK